MASRVQEHERDEPEYPPRGGVPDHALSPDELAELEAFRRMSKVSREATRAWLKQLIRPSE